MRFIHTSDWHLGRTLHGEPLLDAQRGFLGWLVETATAHAVDAVVVAGDIYDRAIPTTDAVQALNDALVGLARAGIAVVMISGNHDSAVRLGFGGALQEAAGVHVRTRVGDLARPVMLADGHGDVAVYGIPYLHPDAAMSELGAQRSHASVLTAAVERIRADAASRGAARVVVLAHAFVTGATGSESERDIRVGGVADVSASVFDGVSYAALGHLHGQQEVSDRVRYSGSPLAFSFSERHQPKSVTLVDLAADGSLGLQLLPTPVPRPLRQVRGQLEDLLARAGTDLGDLAEAWVKVVLTDATRPAAPMDRLREVWPHTLVLDFAPEQAERGPADVLRVAEVSDPVEVCAEFIEWVDSTRPTRAQREALTDAVEAVARAEALA